MKEAVLLVNLGTPDAPTPTKVGKYLTQFLNDKRVIDINPVGRFLLVNLVIVPFRSFSSSKLYHKIWTDKGSPCTPVTIIICARNEEKNIARCLSTLLDQQYDREKMQVLVINDASTDGTVAQAELALKQRGINYRVISNAVKKGKKQSIRFALQFAQHDLIVMCDADTFTESSLWLKNISDFYQQTGNGFIIAPVAIADNEGLLWAMQGIENNVLAIMACGSAYYHNPFLCSGANLAFTKHCYESVNGHTSHMDVASGDDVLFLEDVKKKKQTQVGYLKSEEAIVYTYPCYSFRTLILQKIRWASKFKYNGNFLNIVLALLIFIVNLLWLFCLVYAYYRPAYKNECLLFIFLKLAIDILLLFLASGFIKNKKLIWLALPVGCIYPIYATIISIASVFFNPKWK